MSIATIQEYMKKYNVSESTVYRHKDNNKLVISKINNKNYILENHKCKVISSANIKGGAGKTTAAVNLASFSAISGLRTLLIDMDHQNNCQLYFSPDIVDSSKYNTYDMIYNDVDIADCIVHTDIDGLDVILSSERLVIDAPDEKPEIDYLKRQIDTIKDRYDIVFIDTSPSFDIYNKYSFISADYLIIPVVLDIACVKGVEQLWTGLQPYLDSGKIKVIGLFKNIVDYRYAFTKSFSKKLDETYGNMVFETIITTSSEIKYLMINRKTLFHELKRNKSQKEYKKLFKEILERI